MNFLITGYYFDGFNGSMMHICEIAEHLHKLGYKVTIISQFIEKKIVKYVVNHVKATLLTLDDVNDTLCFDYAICYHFPILPKILTKGVKINKIMFGCLSGFVPVEALPLVAIKNGYKIHVHSNELKDQLITKHSVKDDAILVIPNCVPEDYYNCSYTSSKDIKSVAVVSNHVPPEIRKALKLLSNKGIKTIIYGADDKHIPITSNILMKYDCIISIGKTVQYALAMGVPIFEYDVFGGPGYITTENIEEEEYHNFSGRATRRKLDANLIAREVINSYPSIKSELNYLKVYAERYRVSTAVEQYFANDKYYLPFDCKDNLIYSFSKEQFEWLMKEYDNVCKYKSFYYKFGKMLFYFPKKIIPKKAQKRLKNKLDK